MPGESHCSPREIQKYLNRVSGPLLDRIDLHIEVPAVKFQDITSQRTGEPSATIRERVIAARQVQQQRFKHRPRVTCNARMGRREPRADQRRPKPYPLHNRPRGQFHEIRHRNRYRKNQPAKNQGLN